MERKPNLNRVCIEKGKMKDDRLEIRNLVWSQVSRTGSNPDQGIEYTQPVYTDQIELVLQKSELRMWGLNPCPRYQSAQVSGQV
ncbi:hypothetical protein VNO77_03508 [Canavalia gladiata]|uniref:Uncharacterized protein n=1 Tax=Canavalia gladiata TaxID=3824 RepID=A0AAN9R877_CANGL